MRSFLIVLLVAALAVAFVSARGAPEGEPQAQPEGEPKAQPEGEPKAQPEGERAAAGCANRDRDTCAGEAGEACQHPQGRSIGSRQKRDCQRVFTDMCSAGSASGIRKHDSNICRHRNGRKSYDKGALMSAPNSWKRPCGKFCGGITNKWGICRRVCYEQLNRACAPCEEKKATRKNAEGEKKAEEKKAEEKKGEKKAEEKKGETKDERAAEGTVSNCLTKSRKVCGAKAAEECEHPEGKTIGARQKGDCERVSLEMCTENEKGLSRFDSKICRHGGSRWDKGALRSAPSGWKSPCGKYCGGITNKWGICRRVCYEHLDRICSDECQTAEKKKAVAETPVEKKVVEEVKKENKKKEKKGEKKSEIKEVIIIKEDGEKTVEKFLKTKKGEKIVETEKKGKEEVTVGKKTVRVVVKDCKSQREKLKKVKQLLKQLLKKKKVEAEKKEKAEEKEEKKEEEKAEKKEEEKEEEKAEEKAVEQEKKCPSSTISRSITVTEVLGNPNSECAHFSRILGRNLIPAGKVDGFPGTSGGIRVSGIPSSVNWECPVGAHVVYVKAGRGGEAYVYAAGAFSGTGLRSVKPSVSHVTFCVDAGAPPKRCE